MELRHLRYFVTLAELLHFGKAAAKLHITQPSLSQQIRQLESLLNATLLRRTKRHVELTPAGLAFLDEARDILARADRAAVVVRRTGSSTPAPLRVGVGFFMDQPRISQIVSSFAKLHKMRAEVQTLSVSAQAAALRDDRLDVGFVRPSISERGVRTDIVFHEQLCVALPASHRRSKRETIGLAMLADEPFILPPHHHVPVFHDHVIRVCREAGFVPNAAHEADHWLIVLGMVAAGLGVALLPGFAARTNHRHVRFVRLHPSSRDLQIAIASRSSNTSPLVADFVSVARRVMAATSGRKQTPAHS